jgi:AHBA synthesis associated protein
MPDIVRLRPGTTVAAAVRKAIIFDLDGVIVDSFAVMREAFAIAYAEVVGEGQAPFNEYEKHLGRYFPDIMRIMGLPVAMEAPFVRESYRLAPQVRVFDGVRELLTDLRQRGYRLAVATGKSGPRARSLLKELGLLDRFDHVIGSDEVSRPKPAPDIMLRALQLMGVQPEEALVIGDAVTDIRSARAAGVLAVGATWADIDEAVLRAARPGRAAPALPAGTGGLIASAPHEEARRPAPPGFLVPRGTFSDRLQLGSPGAGQVEAVEQGRTHHLSGERLVGRADAEPVVAQVRVVENDVGLRVEDAGHSHQARQPVQVTLPDGAVSGLHRLRRHRSEHRAGLVTGLRHQRHPGGARQLGRAELPALEEEGRPVAGRYQLGEVGEVGDRQAQLFALAHLAGRQQVQGELAGQVGQVGRRTRGTVAQVTGTHRGVLARPGRMRLRREPAGAGAQLVQDLRPGIEPHTDVRSGVVDQALECPPAVGVGGSQVVDQRGHPGHTVGLTAGRRSRSQAYVQPIARHRGSPRIVVFSEMLSGHSRSRP